MDDRIWELRGCDGDRVHGVITLDFLARGGPEMATRVCNRNGWPPLRPGRPWIECMLYGGPLDGQHEYLDPERHDTLPQMLTFAGPVLACAGAMDPRAVFHPDMAPAVYRLGGQVCGHGRACPYPYRYGR
jgi:hypothetical protein